MGNVKKADTRSTTGNCDGRFLPPQRRQQQLTSQKNAIEPMATARGTHRYISCFRTPGGTFEPWRAHSKGVLAHEKAWPTEPPKIASAPVFNARSEAGQGTGKLPTIETYCKNNASNFKMTPAVASPAVVLVFKLAVE
jgi:hypothetical protein